MLKLKYAIITSLSFLLIITNSVNAQIKDNGVYLTGADFFQHSLQMPFNKHEGCRFSHVGKNLLVVKTPDTVQKFLSINIWGYRQNQTDWRLFNQEFYRVDYVNGICIYTLPGTPEMSPPDLPYFSADINAPVYQVSRKNLIAIFHSDTSFVRKIKNLPLAKSITKWDKQKKRYEFINWLLPSLLSNFKNSYSVNFKSR